MEPKDMTNEQLAEYPRDFTSQDLLSATVEDIQNQPFSSRCKAECDELLRRLNEADALRKENEELKEKIYFFARTFRCYADEAFRFYEKHHLVRETDETRAATANESEASHDR